MNSTSQVVMSNPRSIDNKNQYIWVTSNNIAYIIKRPLVTVLNTASSNLCQSAFQLIISNFTDTSVLNILNIDSYTDNSIVILVAYSPSNSVLIVNGYLSIEQKYHTYQYNLIYSLTIPIPKSLLVNQLNKVRVTNVAFSYNIIIYRSNYMWILDALNGVLLKSYNTNTYTNSVFAKMSNMQNLLLMVFGFGGNIYANIMRSTTVCN